MKYYIEVGEQELELEVTYDAIYEPAKLHGPWENCHPDNSEMTIVSIECEKPYDIPQEAINAEVEEQMDNIMDACWEDYHVECFL
jgi:hypothetical protein